MIKFAIRQNLFYPLMVILFTFLIKIIQILLNYILNFKTQYLLSALFTFSEFIFGIGSILFKTSCCINSSKNKKSMRIKLIQGKSNIVIPNNKFKISILIFFASYFQFFSIFIIRFYVPLKKSGEINPLEQSVRSLQICLSAILCFFTIRINIFKHQILSLLMIIFCTLILFGAEIFNNRNLLKEKIINLSFTLITCISRAFSDTTEKYLFDFDFIDPFVILFIKGIISFLLICLCFLIDKEFIKELNDINEYIINNKKESIIIFLFLLFMIFSGFNSMYRVLTNKQYSPMTMALAESILDPLLVIYYFFFDTNNEKYSSEFWIYFILYLFCSIIMAFCFCTYNEFIILYFCGLEYETFYEIRKRSILIELNNPNSNEQTNFENEEDLSYTVIKYNDYYENDTTLND